MRTPQHPQKQSAEFQAPAVTDPLVDPGNPSHRHQAGATTHSAGTGHRLVALATRTSGYRANRAHQAKTEIATVMLGRLGDLARNLYNFLSDILR